MGVMLPLVSVSVLHWTKAAACAAFGGLVTLAQTRGFLA
jgi:hypothetical protein